jgi:hypothetical protein
MLRSFGLKYHWISDIIRENRRIDCRKKINYDTKEGQLEPEI